ncbi:hypothetical protein [Thioalkalivibrio sulfidiphilus]|uniref:hypothetical protein n=1 Tax=Thioalkalivibrio sulfidiphilus TaxID=1033854 RepID=UPI003B2FD2C3
MSIPISIQMWLRSRLNALGCHIEFIESLNLKGNVVNKFRIVFLCLTLVFLASACAPNHYGTGLIDRKPYTEKLGASLHGDEFYHAKHRYRPSHCFPPINMPICVPNDAEPEPYVKTKKLDMESVSLSLRARDPLDATKMRDLLYLAAAEVSIQRGYDKFTILHTVDVTTCGVIPEISTTGTVYEGPVGNQIMSTTVVSPRGICYQGKSIRALMFSNAEDLEKGVFVSRVNPVSNASILAPVESLYFGTVPNLRYEDFNRTPDSQTLVMTPRNAWQTYYDAAGLARDMREKYGISHEGLIHLVDEKTVEGERINADPILRNRVRSQ